MITSVEVENFQAVRKASINLGWLTVVTGPTGSGKSTVIRAMRLVTFNARGTSFIRHGAKVCKAAIGLGNDLKAVGIERGGRGSDCYRLVRPADQPDDPPQVDTYTKLAGAVPPEVTEVLRLGEVNFAGQFDRPYLLTDSGSQVARVLGELTNVTLVFDAAREANRRKLETARELRAAEARLTDLTTQARGFRGLKGRVAAVREAEEALAAVQRAGQAEERLRALLSQHGQAVSLLAAARAHLERSAPPSGERLAGLLESWERLAELDQMFRGATEVAARDRAAAASARAEEEELHRRLHEALVAAGTCPTCGQAVTAA